MKKTKLTVLFFVLQLFFMLALPCAFVWLQYGGLAVKYKVSTTVIIVLILIFLIFKKICINKWLKKIETKIANIETNALSITDKSAIISNKKAWRMYSVIELVVSAIIPILCLILGIETIKVVEQGLIKLYGVLMFCLVSIIIGIGCKFAEIFTVRLTHEKAVGNEAE